MALLRVVDGTSRFRAISSCISFSFWNSYCRCRLACAAFSRISFFGLRTSSRKRSRMLCSLRSLRNLRQKRRERRRQKQLTEKVTGSMMSHPSQSTQKIMQPNPSRCSPVTPTAPHWYSRSTRSASASMPLISCCDSTTSSQWLARSSSSMSMTSCWLVSLRWQRQLSMSSRRLAVSSVLGGRLLALQQASACSFRQACVRKSLVCPESISVLAACSSPRRLDMPLRMAVVSDSQARLLRKADLLWLRNSMERGVSSWRRKSPREALVSKSLGNFSCVLRKQSLATRSLKVVSSPSRCTIPRPSGLKFSTISMVFSLQRHSMLLRALPADTPCTSLNPRSIIQIGNGMRASKGKTGSLWLRGSKPRSSVCTEELPDFGLLKREAKKIEIMTRMDRRAKTNESSFTCARPKSTTAPRGHHKALSFKQVEGLYRKEQSQLRETLAETQPSREQGHLGGLLGEWQRYQELSKKELIEKLISLEHLANAIFKRNKHLEEELEAVRQQQPQ